jgi:hypothetical protein
MSLLLALLAAAALRFEVAIDPRVQPTPVTGRVLVILSRDPSEEPRFQIAEELQSQQVFGIDVNDLQPGEPVTIDATTSGYPAASLAEISAGEYAVQALLNRYETFRLQDGRALLLPPDRGEGQQWNRKPGNLLTRPARLRVDPSSATAIRLTLDQSIPPLGMPRETDLLKHVVIESRLLSQFWGRRIDLGAWVLLPPGWADQPNERFPLVSCP